MKRLLFLSILILAFTQCSDFLDLAPISSPNSQNFYKTTSDFENALIGTYSILKSGGVYNSNFQMIGDLRSDNTEMGTTAAFRVYYYEMSEFRDQVDNTIINSVWDDHYRGITLANLILDNIDNLEAAESIKEGIKGEAMFLRGLFYFNLVRVFGDIPLVTNSLKTIEAAYEKGRTEKFEVYKQIIDDLLYAERVLPITPKQIGKATKGASSALLGKVYLTIQDFNNAKIKLEAVINSKQYKLLDNYKDLWIAGKKNHLESIFDVQFKRASGTGTGSSFAEIFTPYLYPHLSYYSTGGGYNIPTLDLITSYEENDIRKDASLREYYVSEGDTIDGLAGRYCIKFYSIPTQGQGGDDNWPVIRYGDVILMYAEVLNEISYQSNGLAFEYLNMIRKRAGLPFKTSGNPNSELSIDSQEEFRLAIEQERRVELAFEGHRWFDLVRTGRAIKVLAPKISTPLKEYMLLLPIPQTQIDINPEKITQNTGY